MTLQPGALVDSHCHLDMAEFDEDRDALIARARAAGVGRMVTICVKLSQYDQVRAVADAHDDIYCSVGVHPHYADTERADRETLLARTGDKNVVAIGETGLDFYYDNSDRDRQRDSFRLHMDVAREVGLPLVVHTRDADQETLDLIAEGLEPREAGESRLRGVIHCFSGGRALAEGALELGFYISLSGIVTFKKALDLQGIARDLPRDRVLIETDAPYLAPVPKRGKRNEPSFVAHTADFLASLHGVSTEAIAHQTTENFHQLFDRVPPYAAAA